MKILLRTFRWAFLRLFLFGGIIGFTGCLVPEGTKVTSGHRYTEDAISFLDLPDATRDETIANLGLPAWESHDSRVLVYLWRTSFNWLFLPPENKLGIRKSHVVTDEKRVALLVAYDENGRVIAHAIRQISEDALESVCSQWVQR